MNMNTNAPPTVSQHRYASSKSGNDDKDADDDKDETSTTTRLEENATDTSTATMANQPLDLGLPGAQKGGKKLAIVFTCTVCNTRSAKQFTEQAYKHGVVMVMCPGCDSRHLIADNLSMFDDDKMGFSIERQMEEMGQHVTKVTNDDVMELTLDQWVREEKVQQLQADAAAAAGDDQQPPNNDTNGKS